jgi:hypothetical protein
MGRPKKVVKEAVVETTKSDTQDMATRLELLEKALLSKAAEVEALRAAGSTSYGGQRVVLQNTGYVQLAIPVEGEGTLILDGRGVTSTASVPVHVYARLKRETDWFEQGYVTVLGEVNDNPNIIVDPEAWVANIIEDRVVMDMQKITSEGALNKLWTYVEAIKNPTAKVLLIKNAIQNRYQELFDITLVEDVVIPGA